MKHQCLRSPKKHDPLTPPPVAAPATNMGIMAELEGLLGIRAADDKLGEHAHGNTNWDCFNWAEFSGGVLKYEAKEIGHDDEEEEEEEEEEKMKGGYSLEGLDITNIYVPVKEETVGFWEEEKALSLNLNYQDVMDAWSDQRSPWAAADDEFMGEVPTMDEERGGREARVMRYKAKRQSRLFSKKIRYQVRKLNAEKRPRLKGRFVKRIPDETVR